MNNFDLTKFLAEGKLHEAMSPQDVVDIADTVAEEFTKESADEGDFMIYSVGEMDVDDMTFELDTDTTAQTPERILKMSNLGVGEGWGGSFRINPKEEGYEVRNSEKGGLVAIIDGMGNFRMLSNDESKAEMGMADGEKTDYMQRRKETDDYMEENKEEVKETLDDSAFDMADSIYDAIGGIEFKKAIVKAMSTDDAKLYLSAIMRDYALDEAKDEEGEAPKSNKMKKSELKEMIKAAMLAETSFEETTVYEAEEDDVEDVEIDTEEEVDVDVDMDVDMDSDAEGIDVKQDADTDLGGTVGDVQDNLEAALAAARQLGDEKLEDQIGNTLTFFTRQHVVKEADLELDVNRDETKEEAELGLEEITRMQKIAGIK